MTATRCPVRSVRTRDMIYRVCCLAGSTTLLEEARASTTGLRCAIRRFDTPALYNWLIDAFSYHGLSDAAVRGYIDHHGQVTWSEIDYRLSRSPKCPKLRSYWDFYECGYQKTAHTCSAPPKLPRCPLPRHKLRNGRINQTAYSLYFFVRDIAGGDLVTWIDRQLLGVAFSPRETHVERMTAAIIDPMRQIFGVSDKLLAIGLSPILLAAEDQRKHWHSVGAGLVAIDTLVHNFLHRTGILRASDAEHPYGPGCYAEGGCASILRSLSGQINASQFNVHYPELFPRFVQHAIWQYCAQDGLAVCNSTRVKNGWPCNNAFCRLFSDCEKVALNS